MRRIIRSLSFLSVAFLVVSLQSTPVQAGEPAESFVVSGKVRLKLDDVKKVKRGAVTQMYVGPGTVDDPRVERAS